MFLFCFLIVAGVVVADELTAAASSQANPLCCILPGGSDCRCITGWDCDPSKVVSGFCAISDSCFQNCKISNWFLGVIIAASCLIIIIFIILLLVCCRARKRRV